MDALFLKFQDYLISEKCVANNTLEAYRRDITQFLEFLEKNHTISELNQVTCDHVKDFLKHLRQNNIGPKSASRKLSALKTLANYLSRYHDFMPFTQGVVFPQLPKQLQRHLTQEQMQALFAAADKDASITGQRNKVMLSMLYVC